MSFASPFFDCTFTSAAVRVVLPWSIWPIVPTFTWGLLRTNFSLAMTVVSWDSKGGCYVGSKGNLDPTTGLEPVTSSLPRKCSTTELGGRRKADSSPGRCHRPGFGLGLPTFARLALSSGSSSFGAASGSRYVAVVFRWLLGGGTGSIERETGFEPATFSLEG